MASFRSGRRWAQLLTAAGLVTGGALLARSVPADVPAQPTPGGFQVAQGGFPGGTFGPGGGQFGMGGGPFGPGGGIGMAQGGRQGGTFPGGGVFGLNPGQVVQVAAFCTDLLSEPPDATTRFTGGSAGRVALAGGGEMTLARALEAGIVAVRGRDDSFDPIRRDGSLALDLYLANLSEVPVRVTIEPGAAITPKGQAAQPLPAGSERLFAAAAKKGLTYSNSLQFAIWGARGSTAEEVEQTQMVRLPAQELARVQTLLDESGVRTAFDSNRGLYAIRYEDAVERLGEKADEVEGTTLLATGTKATVEGARGPDGQGVVSVKPARRDGGEFFYRAQFTDRKDGKVAVKLFHLVTGRPVRVNRGSLVLQPSKA